MVVRTSLLFLLVSLTAIVGALSQVYYNSKQNNSLLKSNPSSPLLFVTLSFPSPSPCSSSFSSHLFFSFHLHMLIYEYRALVVGMIVDNAQIVWGYMRLLLYVPSSTLSPSSPSSPSSCAFILPSLLLYSYISRVPALFALPALPAFPAFPALPALPAFLASPVFHIPPSFTVSSSYLFFLLAIDSPPLSPPFLSRLLMINRGSMMSLGPVDAFQCCQQRCVHPAPVIPLFQYVSLPVSLYILNSTLLHFLYLLLVYPITLSVTLTSSLPISAR